MLCNFKLNKCVSVVVRLEENLGAGMHSLSVPVIVFFLWMVHLGIALGLLLDIIVFVRVEGYYLGTFDPLDCFLNFALRLSFLLLIDKITLHPISIKRYAICSSKFLTGSPGDLKFLPFTRHFILCYSNVVKPVEGHILVAIYLVAARGDNLSLAILALFFYIRYIGAQLALP